MNSSVIGIVAEFNPFHNGHRHLIEEARTVSGADGVVVVLSGNFVQRGRPAEWDKWFRTKTALQNGADLVLEIPVRYCLGDASVYAGASVRLLEATGVVTHQAFGSECGDAGFLLRTAELLGQHEAEIGKRAGELGLKGLSYPAARARAFQEVTGLDPEVLKRPNDILAVEYLKAGRRLVPLPIRRMGAGYHDAAAEGSAFQSSSGIRAAMDSHQSVEGMVPDAADALSARLHPDHDIFFDLVRYRIMTASPEELMDAPSGEEGLSHLLRRSARTAGDTEELIQTVKSKRYTYTRISRLLCQILLGITREDLLEEPSYLRVLGFRKGKGQALLREMTRGKGAGLPVITNVNRSAGIPPMLEQELAAADLYHLLMGQDISACSDRRREIIIL